MLLLVLLIKCQPVTARGGACAVLVGLSIPMFNEFMLRIIPDPDF